MRWTKLPYTPFKKRQSFSLFPSLMKAARNTNPDEQYVEKHCAEWRAQQKPWKWWRCFEENIDFLQASLFERDRVAFVMLPEKCSRERGDAWEWEKWMEHENISNGYVTIVDWVRSSEGRKQCLRFFCSNEKECDVDKSHDEEQIKQNLEHMGLYFHNCSSQGFLTKIRNENCDAFNVFVTKPPCAPSRSWISSLYRPRPEE